MRLPTDGPPELWIVAGPNGSGKSSAYTDVDIEEAAGRSVWIINPDLLTERIVGSEGLTLEDANKQAVIRIERWLEASIEAHQTVGVETVLSTGKYRRLVELSQRRGFRMRLIYVLLDRPERNIERVRLRTLKGGHDVPAEKIVARYWRSLEQLPWFLKHADEAMIYDNSGATPRLICRKADEIITLDPNALGQVVRAVEAAGAP